MLKISILAGDSAAPRAALPPFCIPALMGDAAGCSYSTGLAQPALPPAQEGRQLGWATL